MKLILCYFTPINNHYATKVLVQESDKITPDKVEYWLGRMRKKLGKRDMVRWTMALRYTGNTL